MTAPSSPVTGPEPLVEQRLVVGQECAHVGEEARPLRQGSLAVGDGSSHRPAAGVATRATCVLIGARKSEILGA
jgi:hypothetical protein